MYKSKSLNLKNTVARLAVQIIELHSCELDRLTEKGSGKTHKMVQSGTSTYSVISHALAEMSTSRSGIASVYQ